jgi:hypothetical protein
MQIGRAASAGGSKRPKKKKAGDAGLFANCV